MPAMTWTESQYQAYLRRQEEKARPRRDGSMSEAALMEHIRALARRSGWLVYHTHDSRGSEAGFPDLVLCKPGRLILAECKTERGKVTEAQQQWIDMLRHSVPGVEAYVWRPSMLEDIARILTSERTHLCCTGSKAS